MLVMSRDFITWQFSKMYCYDSPKILLKKKNNRENPIFRIEVNSGMKLEIADLFSFYFMYLV